VLVDAYRLHPLAEAGEIPLGHERGRVLEGRQTGGPAKPAEVRDIDADRPVRAVRNAPAEQKGLDGPV